MGWVERKLDYAGGRLEGSVEHAAEKLSGVIEQGIDKAGAELRDVLREGSREIDTKLDKISQELSNQRSFTKNDVRELVDYAADRFGSMLDARVQTAKGEFAALVEEKVEYMKNEVDSFFIRRQQDLARERRRLLVNVLIAVLASLGVAAVSLGYHRVAASQIDLFSTFRIAFVSLSGGYLAYLLVQIVRKYQRMAEHRKDLMFLTMRYWGVLRPQSLFWHLVLLLGIAGIYILLFFPHLLLQIAGAERLLDWLKLPH
ncbi:MAG: hypothetical protein EKK59_08165 [Neisseriaceae bacterium]|nr:MAG: hypothetical protein EKK59_08165 [Neisseriaceae bacterium]